MNLTIPKLFSLSDAVKQREKAALSKRKVVLTNGCFDLLHTGHIHFLQEAAQQGDELWIAINSDTSVKALKGPLRPVQSEQERAFALGALACVKGLFIFSSARLDGEIRAFKPDCYVKAGDYNLNTLDKSEREALEAIGTHICFLSFLPGYSTTQLIKRIASAAATF